MYEGKWVRLRELRVEEAPQLQKWMNDLRLAQCLRGGAALPYTLEQERQWVLDNGAARADSCQFSVERLEDGRLIGGCGYFDYSGQRRSCKVGFFIGDADMRGRGYGTDMIQTLLRLCFTELGVRKVSLNVFAYNERAVRLYERLGFVREGTFREEVFCRDRWWDEYRYGLFREEWRNGEST